MCSSDLVPYAAPENYISAAEEARRSYLESKRKQAERRAAEERELRDLEFGDWRSSLKADELNAIVPEVVRNLPKAREESLKAHFEESVWPALRTALPGGDELERMEIRAAIEQSLGKEIGT